MAKKFSLRKDKKVIAAVGVGVAAAAAATAGAYFLAGKRGAKNRKKVKAWATKAKAEVVKGLKRAKSVNWRTYTAEVNRVLRRYRRLKNVPAAELAQLTRELKGYWKNISREVARTRTAATKAARRIISKVGRKRRK